MESLINRRVKEIEISGIRKIANLVAKVPGAVTLTIGQPDFPTPGHILEAAKRAIDENRTGYTANAGLLELRQAAAGWVQAKYGQTYDPNSEVIVTLGATEALEMALLTLLEEGSEVILPAPVYPGYEPLVRLCGGIPVLVDTSSSGFRITAEQIRSHLTEKTRVVILGYPSNPTGRILDAEGLAEIAELLKSREVFVISDEIYSELVYEGTHRSIALEPGMREKTIVINGLSKSHSMTGWRIGFTFAPEEITKHMVKVHQYHVTCASSISQYAALEALTGGPDDALPMREEYRKRRDYSVGRLEAMGMELNGIPEGAFYLFPSIRPFGLSSEAFAYKLLEEQKVGVVPGDAFSQYGEGYIRLSYAYSMAQLEEAFNRMERFVQSLKG
ncbi:aminotransferase A [Gorillibacterium timonense]|uniref:aminotransferase A n=1 Tax=Gorillibacterium timonense TaxID=1689269 RepID=UPI00071C9389|nr:aminotransferase A [Gorillibacterium timonense]